MANISINFSEVIGSFESVQAEIPATALPQLQEYENLVLCKSDAEDVHVAATAKDDNVAVIIGYVSEASAKTKTIKVEFDTEVTVDFYLTDGKNLCQKIKPLKGKSIAFMMDPGTVVQLVGTK